MLAMPNLMFTSSIGSNSGECVKSIVIYKSTWLASNETATGSSGYYHEIKNKSATSYSKNNNNSLVAQRERKLEKKKSHQILIVLFDVYNLTTSINFSLLHHFIEFNLADLGDADNLKVKAL